MMADVVVVVLQTAILSPRAHIVGLVRLATRHCDGLLEAPERIGGIEVHSGSIRVALLPATPLRLSLLLLLQKPHSYGTALLIRCARWRTVVAEAAAREVALLWAGDQVGPGAELLLRHAEAARTARPQRLTVLNWRQKMRLLLLLLLLLSGGALLHVAIEAGLGVVRVDGKVLARVCTTLGKALVVLRLEALGQLARGPGRGPVAALVKHSLLRAVQTISARWILAHMLLKAAGLGGVRTVGDLGRRPRRALV